jgi:hypothetical protein
MGDTAAEAVESMIGEPWGDAPHPSGLLLAALRWAWDGLYLITEATSSRGLIISRSDGNGTFRAADPLEARELITADFARRPVAQRHASGALQRRAAFEYAHPDAWWMPPSTLHRVVWRDASHDDAGWHARRLDDGSQLHAATPEELNGLISANYNARPVPRQFDPGNRG